MATITSFDKNFEITAISFSPNIITVGEKTNYSITIKNVSGRRINTMYATLRLHYRAADGKVYGSYDEYMVGSYPFKQEMVAWANGVVKTFTGSFTFTASSSYPPKIDTRLMPAFKGSDIGYPSDLGGNDRLGLMLSITTDSDLGDSFSNGDAFFDLRGENSENLYVIDARYTPTISVFAAERSIGNIPNDEGENLLMDVHLKKSAAARIEYMSMYLYYRDRSKPDTDPLSVSLTSLINSALVSEIQTVISETLGKNSDWDLILWFGDKYESVTATLLVPRAFANVHLSGAQSGGVCFGSFSRATEGNPLFQCYYPSEFYGTARFDGTAQFNAGIRGVTNYEAAGAEVETGGKWIDGRKIYRMVVPVNISAGFEVLVHDFKKPIEMLDLRGYVIRGTQAWRFPPCWGGGGGNSHLIWMGPDTEKLLATSDISLTGHLIIEYVKPT